MILCKSYMYYLSTPQKYYSEITGEEYSREDLEMIEEEYLCWRKSFIERPEVELKELRKIYKNLSTESGDRIEEMIATRQSLVDNSSPGWLVEVMDDILEKERARYLKYARLSKASKKSNSEWEEKRNRAKAVSLYLILGIQPSDRPQTKTKCPFHLEKTPSFVIYTEKNTFYAFCCNEYGDSIDLYAKINNVSKGVAINNLNL